MKKQKYIVTIEMPDGDMISSEWLKDLIESDCCIEEEDEGRFSISVEEISTLEDLEEEIKRYLREECSSDDEPTIGEIARHFAEWQKERMIRDCSVQASYEAEIEKAEERGYNLCKEQMLKDAIERTVKIDSGGYPYIDITAELYDYDHDVPLAKEGELVKIVIVKED